MEDERDDEAISIGDYERWKRIVLAGVLPLSGGGSAWLTYSGLTAFTERSVAVVLSAISFGLAWLCWGFLCEFAPRAGKRSRAGLRATVLYPTIVLVGLTSTTLGWMGLAVPEAEKLAMVSMVDEGAVVLKKLERQRAAEAGALPVLAAQAAEWEAMSEDERRNGRFFRRGRGKITGDLGAIARAYGSACEMLEQDRRRFGEAGREAEAALEAMRRIADETSASTGEMKEASGKFSRQVYRFDEALAVLGVSSLDTALLGIDGAMSQQRNSPLISQGDRRREREKVATERITKMAEDARASVGAALQGVEREPVDVPLMRLPLAGEALAEHLAGVLHLGAYPVAIDLFLPPVCLLILSFLRRRLPRCEGAPSGEGRSSRGSQRPTGALPGRKEVEDDGTSVATAVPRLEEALARLRRGRQGA